MDKSSKIMSRTDYLAKVPDDVRNWSAIDIYLFSNGQTQTPPRKYHFTAEELDWWDGVLNYLAKSQFGSSTSSIELYTIDGHKINGPLDLGDGMPYVAVLPPATFFDSGYEKYLLKASRSWEKRQAKRSAEVKTDDLKADCPDACCVCPNRDDGGNDTKHVSGLSQINGSSTKPFISPRLPQSDQELTAIKASDDIVPIESALTRPQRSSTPKCAEDPSLDQPPSKIKTGSAPQRPSIIRNYRKRSSGQHPSFAKSASPQTGINKVPSSVTNTKENNQKKINNKIPVKANERNALKTKGRILQNQSKKNPLSPLARRPAKGSPVKQATTTVTPDIPKFSQEMPLTAQNSPSFLPNIPKSINNRQPKNSLIRTPFIQDLITDKEITREYSTTINENTKNEAAFPDMDKTQILHSAAVDEMVSCHIENNGIDQTAQTDKEVLTNVISVSLQEVARLENGIDQTAQTDKEVLTGVISVSLKEVTQTASEEPKNDISFSHQEVPQTNNKVPADFIFIPDPNVARKNKDTNVITYPDEELAQMDEIESTHLLDISPPHQEVAQMDTEVIGSKSSHTNNVNSKVRLNDNNVAVVNKEDGTNVNLNIDVQKGKTNTNFQDQESTVLEIRKITSMSDIFKKSNLQNVNEQSVAVESKSLHSIISPTNNFTKVVVVQCGCCGTRTTIPKLNTVPVFKDQNGFFILMPGPTPAATQSCGCGTNNQNEQKPATVVNKQSDSCLKELSVTKSENIYPCAAQDVGVVMTVMHCGIRSRINDCHDNELDSITLAQRVCIEDHYSGGRNSNILSQQIGKTELLEENRINCTSINKSNTEDSYAQTEWCCMLMQVKQHDDHHYSFHLPPLELVKHYS